MSETPDAADSHAEDREDGPEHTPGELLAMDEQTARETLTVQQFGRYEKLHELEADADETKERWAEENERVTELTVHADAEKLGTEVDWYGNDVLVHVDSDDAAFRDTIETFREEFDDVGTDEIDTLEPERAETLTSHLLTLLDHLVVQWNGHDWDALPQAERDAILSEARDKWGLDAAFGALMDAMTAIRKEREEQVDVVESFRSETGRGDR